MTTIEKEKTKNDKEYEPPSSSSQHLQNIIQSAISNWNSAVFNSPHAQETDRNVKRTFTQTEGLHKGENDSKRKLIAHDGDRNFSQHTKSRSSLTELNDSVSYEQRLMTFNVKTYFAKPLSISPLICARFGWKNTSRDLLTCTNPKCRAEICVAIHPVLGRKAVDDLSSQYRRMLATAHVKSCPFRSDAERWLINYPLKEDLPSYLLPVCQELSIFYNTPLNQISSWTPMKVHRMARDLDQVITFVRNHFGAHIDDKSISYKVDFPKEAAGYLIEQMPKVLKIEHDMKDPKVQELSKQGPHNLYVNRFFQYLTRITNTSVDVDDFQFSNENTMRHEMKKIFDEILLDIPPRAISTKRSTVPSRGSAVLALFGWAPKGIAKTHSSETVSNEENDCRNKQTDIYVHCRICLARAIVKVNDDSTGTEMNKTESFQMNPIKSHRFFCPYVCSLSVASLPRKPGWQIVMDKLIQYGNQNHWNFGNDEDTLKKKGTTWQIESDAHKDNFTIVQNVLKEEINQDNWDK